MSINHTGLLWINDAAGQYPASYYAATADHLPAQPPLEGDISCDVAIIGAGFTGLNAALTLAQAGKDVVLVDAHRFAWGASGRNGGQLGTGQRLDQLALESLFGKAQAHVLWDIAQASVTHVKNLIASLAIDCDLKPGIMHLEHRASDVETSKAYVDHMANVYGHDMTFVPKSSLPDFISSPLYHGGYVDWNAAHLHPLKYALGLAKTVLAQSVRCFEFSPVESLESTGNQHRLTTPKGSIKCAQVITAGNGYLGDLVPQINQCVMPINNFILATEPLSREQMEEVLPQAVAVADSKFVVNYFRPTADNRLLFGGGETYRYRFPNDPKQFVREHMLKVFPQLAETNIDYAWGGTLGITMNRLPCLKQWAPNAFNASGFSGHGLGMASLSGCLLAEACIQGNDYFKILEDLPQQKFPGGTILRGPLLVLAMLYYSMLDRL